MPGWVPSWVLKDVWPSDCQDSKLLPTDSIQDAIRKNDQKKVLLKLVDIIEYHIMTFLSSKELANAPENHCVPILEVLKPRDGKRYVIIVIPLLRTSLNLPFETVGEVIEFLQQIFEGIRFMHEHRGLSRTQQSDECGGGFHAADPSITPGWRGKAKQCFSRTKRPLQYYWIDFWISASAL
ncbi:hypothetical protein K443DRAFT_8477 [Laccaria amethystina LaAM-08-1]|uniref:Uncharacterized protein n=1 Tax=Laccaria amethystina LaAM-08-1 TaxID=1095629 RepID=A0A0C9XP09_9AGAR|nr:hypothetical protein K443DRAFT_8477 [Laccaria amethystina LaAM-08-1]